MASRRLQQLQALLDDAPGDKLLRLAMAMEHKRGGDLERAAAELEALVRDQPGYLPPYGQLALVLAGLDRAADAVEVCRAGALQCLVAGDRKARQELLELRERLRKTS